MISKYVDNKELKRIVDEGNLKLYKVKNVLKKRGILLTSTNSNIVAEQIYPILWGICDMSEYKDSIDDSNNYIKSSLIEVNCIVENEIIDTVESAFTMSNYMKKQYSFDSLCRDSNNNLSMRLKYPKSKIGKNELMSIQNKYVDIFVRKISDNKAIFDIRQASSTEMKEVNKFLSEVLAENDELKMRRINLSNLTNENRIDFFDELNLHDFEEWRFLTVTKMELKKNETSDEEVTLDEDEADDQAIGNLRGITSAIVNGTSIRTNSFVQECLKNQFSISTMGYKYQHKTELIQVIVEVNFKYDDIKIDISKTYEYDDIEKKEKVHPLMMSRQEEIIKNFQEVAYNIYEDIVNRQNIGH